MAEKYWEQQKIQFCDHAGCKVALEVEIVYPSDFLCDQPAHLVSHRCSNGLECNQWNKPACVWAGTNPTFDPFR
jgi:hypothetical protein